MDKYVALCKKINVKSDLHNVSQNYKACLLSDYKKKACAKRTTKKSD